MPTYEYKCKFCHQISDAFQRMSDAPLTKCPHCGKEGLERIVSGGAGVIYKGEGWYVTDYSKKSSGGKETPSAASSKPETKNDSKPETTSDSSSSSEKKEASAAPKSSDSSSSG